MKKRSILPRKRIIITALVIAAVVIFSASLTVYAMAVRTVLIYDDGGEHIAVNTTRSDGSDILRARGIVLEEDDYLDLSSFDPDDDSVIRIHRARQVTLVDDGEAATLVSAGTVRRLLEQQDIELGERDTISYPLRELLVDDMEIVIQRAFDVLIEDYDAEYTIYLTEGTVAQALMQAEVVLEENDFVVPGPSYELEPGMTIEVMRVEYRERERTTAIDFEVVRRNNANMDLGTSRLEQQGARGERRIVYSDRYVNGELDESVIVAEVIVKAPVNEIRVIGTRTVRLNPGLTPISTLQPPANLVIENGRPTNMVRRCMSVRPRPTRIMARGLRPQVCPRGLATWR